MDLDKFLCYVMAAAIALMGICSLPNLWEEIQYRRQENRDLKAKLKRKKFKILKGGKKD